jgi:hypothetical protein
MSERNGEETFIVPEISALVMWLMSVKQQNAEAFGTVVASASGTLFRAPSSGLPVSSSKHDGQNHASRVPLPQGLSGLMFRTNKTGVLISKDPASFRIRLCGITT